MITDELHCVPISIAGRGGTSTALHVRFTSNSGHTLGQRRHCVRVMRQSVAVYSLAQRAPSFGLWPFSLWHAALAFSSVEALAFSFEGQASATPPRATHRLAVAWCHQYLLRSRLPSLSPGMPSQSVSKEGIRVIRAGRVRDNVPSSARVTLSRVARRNYRTGRGGGSATANKIFYSWSIVPQRIHTKPKSRRECPGRGGYYAPFISSLVRAENPLDNRFTGSNHSCYVKCRKRTANTL